MKPPQPVRSQETVAALTRLAALALKQKASPADAIWCVAVAVYLSLCAHVSCVFVIFVLCDVVHLMCYCVLSCVVVCCVVLCCAAVIVVLFCFVLRVKFVCVICLFLPFYVCLCYCDSCLSVSFVLLMFVLL